MKVYGKDLEGAAPWELFPYSHTGRDSDLTSRFNVLRKYLDEGGKVMIEITKGARKGTIGELIIPSTNIDELYNPRYKSGLGGNRRVSKIKEWQIKFDDRKNVIKIPQDRWDYKWNGVLRFGLTETVWDFTSVARPKEELPDMFDHFGTKIEVGQFVLFITGTGTSQYIRMGKISRWSAKGTIWANTIRTREKHGQPAEVQIQGSVNIVVLDDDVRKKAMLARLTLE
jgi:hypothetical protein